MPIGIGVEGGVSRKEALRNVGKVDSEKALDTLQQIRTQLSQPGRDSGVLTLHNRTSGSGMTLERKNGFQLLFQDDKRLDDTVKVMKSLLAKAGQHGALQALDHYLVFGKGDHNKIESSKMLEILNRHLPTVGSSLDELYKYAKIETVEGKTFANVKKEAEDGGASGLVFMVTVDGQERALKTFWRPEPMDLDRTNTGRNNEAMGLYLGSRKSENRDYLSDKVNIAEPSSYLISLKKGDKEEYRLVDARWMKGLLEEAKESKTEVKCHGLVMPRAPGSKMEDLIKDKEAPLSETEKKRFCQSTLQSIKGLNERGFVHRDLKPANIFYDRNKATLIDTGTLFKQSKHQDKPQYIQGDYIGSLRYMHPRAEGRQPHGTETDLYALGVMTLEMEHEKAFLHLRGAITQAIGAGTFSKDWLIGELESQIGRKDVRPETRDSLVHFRQDLDNPTKLAGFSVDCLVKACMPATEWAKREVAQQTYEELLKHDGLKF